MCFALKMQTPDLCVRRRKYFRHEPLSLTEPLYFKGNGIDARRQRRVLRRNLPLDQGQRLARRARDMSHVDEERKHAEQQESASASCRPHDFTRNPRRAELKDLWR